MRKDGEELPPGIGPTVTSWLLLIMAVATFTPCILLPEWRAYQRADGERQAQAYRLSLMNKALDRARENVDALRDDPAVISRVAQRDLRFRARTDTAIRVAAEGAPEITPDQAQFQPVPASLPPVVDEVAGRLPGLDYDRIFCDDETRIIIMCMSVSLMMLGLCISTARRPLQDR